MGFWAFRDKVAPGPPSASGTALSEAGRERDCPCRTRRSARPSPPRGAPPTPVRSSGRLLGSQGVSLEETLADLRTTYALVLGTEPAFTDACAVALGWSEATLAYLHQLSCADPLTGLASMAHLRGRLTELYRGVARRVEGRLAARPLRPRRGRGSGAAPDRARRRGLRRRPADVADRGVRPLGLRRWRDHLPDRPSPHRRPGARGTRRSAVVRACCAASPAWASGNGGVRIWTESLPSTGDRPCASLLDELSRDQAL